VFLGLYSIAAAALAHANFADPNQLTHFFKNLSILGGFLAFGVAGPGAYSLDAKKNSAENRDTVQDQAN
jgi:putative oxidoreductase